MVTEKRATFNEVAELYDKARNHYPDSLFDELHKLTQLPSAARILEIGSGTGIATLPLAERGYRIIGVELGHDMAAVVRHKLAAFSNVDIQLASFEDWQPPAEPFDLVLSATAFHWLDPDIRFQKTASVLKDRGHLAIVKYHHIAGGDQSFFDQVQLCYEQYKPHSKQLQLPRIENMYPDTEELVQCGLYERPVIRRYVMEETYNRQQYLDLLATYSDHRTLEPLTRQRLFECIGTLIDNDYDGKVRKCYLHELILARKA